MVDYYKTLGVDRNASAEDIKRAYRQLSMKFHPDRNPGDADSEEIFKKVNEAYSVLSNPDKRRQYDNPNPFGGPGDMFGNGGARSPFGFNFNFRPRPQKPDFTKPIDGKLILAEVQISLSVFVYGGDFRLVVSYDENCDMCSTKGFINGQNCEICSGTGYVQKVHRDRNIQSFTTSPCPHCKGKGKLGTDRCLSCKGAGHRHIDNKEVMFYIPPAPKYGSRFVAQGVGRVGINGGRRGDVGIVITGISSPNLENLSPAENEKLKELLKKCYSE